MLCCNLAKVALVYFCSENLILHKFSATNIVGTNGAVALEPLSYSISFIFHIIQHMEATAIHNSFRKLLLQLDSKQAIQRLSFPTYSGITH